MACKQDGYEVISLPQRAMIVSMSLSLLSLEVCVCGSFYIHCSVIRKQPI